MKFVTYGSSGKSLKGFVAGDTDMLFTNMPKAVSGITKNGISCWANTGPTKVMDMEPMTTLFPDYQYNDLQSFAYLDSANLSRSDLAKFRSAWNNVLKHESLVGYIEKKKLTHPSAYGDLSPAQWAKELEKSGQNWIMK
jgi:tripartite-type tricarboxylate transporter receptor subunit TctC